MKTKQLYRLNNWGNVVCVLRATPAKHTQHPYFLRGYKRFAFSFWVVWILLMTAAGCAFPGQKLPEQTPSATPPLPSATASLTPTVPTLTPTETETPTPEGGLPVWGTFSGPRGKLVTPIPPPMPAAELSSEVKAIILAGLDRPSPYNGRADTLLLVIYHPRLAKAALISIPPDLFGYMPGQTMQRLNSAYPLGGGSLLQQTIAYNLGIMPDFWLAAHIDDFALLIDELGGLTVPVLEDIPNQCGDILYVGEVKMNGEQVLCYARLRLGSDEAARGLRQQQILRLIFDHLVQNGNLAQAADLFNAFHSRIDTNLSILDALNAIPLALRLGDPSRTAYFQIGPDQTSLWQISEQPPATVFLPKPDAIRAVLQKAAAFVNEPSPQSDMVITLEYQLTRPPEKTTSAPSVPTQTATPRPNGTATLARSLTPSKTGPTPTGPTPTASQTLTASITPTPTITLTPTITKTFAP